MSEDSVEPERGAIEHLAGLFREQCAELAKALTPEDLVDLSAIPEDQLAVKCHFGLAHFVRNRWLRGGDSRLMAAFAADGSLPDPDGVSAVVVHLLWCQLHGLEPTDDLLLKLLRDHLVPIP